jgi:rod shape determining protein RodA
MAEEYGFMGGIIVLLLYAVMIANSFHIAEVAKDRFGCFIAIGSGVLFMVHIGINIGMTLGLMPITGIPLPFLSYGGSFLILCCFLQGMLQSVYRYRYTYT